MSNYSDLKLVWQSEISAIAGYGLQARRMLKPLIDGGADIKIIPDEDYLPDYMKINDPFWKAHIELSKQKPDYPLRVCWCLPPRARPDPKAKNIFYAQWETTEYPKEWVSIINSKANAFCVGCDSLIKSAKTANIAVPIYSLPSTVDTTTWCPEGPILNINEIGSDIVKFLFIGNFIPRKNLEELIHGFSVAFQGQKDVCLIIKTWASANTAESKNHIISALGHMKNKLTGIEKPKISIITDLLDEISIIKLVRGCHIYTNVSKGEGFDLPLTQAMAMEKLIVATRFLAHEDYLNDTNSLDVKYSLVPCIEASAPLYDSYQYWSRPDMYDYITKLREAYSLVRNGKAKALGANARNTIIEKYSVERNTKHLADTLRTIRDNNEQKISQQAIIKKLA